MENSNSNDKVSNQQMLAKKYIEENDLEKITSEMLNNLVHERVKNPIIYMIKYLAGLMTEEERKQNGIVVPEPLPKGTPLAKYPFLEEESLLKKHMTKSLFNSIKYFKTKSGGNINNILKISEMIPEDPIGCLLTDGNSLNIFSELLTPIINEYHSNGSAIAEYKKASSPLTQLSFPFLQRNIGKIYSFKLSYSRSLKDFPYCNIIANDKRALVESELIKVINALISDKTLPPFQYITFKDNNEKWKDILSFVQFNEDWNQKAQMSLNWPSNRSIYYMEDYSLFILINFTSHLQLISTINKSQQTDLPLRINDARKILSEIEKTIKFDYHKQFGYLNSAINLLGAGLTLSSSFEVKDAKMRLLNKYWTLEDLLKKLSLDSFTISVDDSVTLSSSYRLSKGTELEFIESFYSMISGLINMNKDSDLSFEKKTFDKEFSPSDPYIKTSYDKAFNDIKYIISANGLTINNLISLYQVNPCNPLGIVLTDADQLKAFELFILSYLNQNQQFDLNKVSMKEDSRDSPKFRAEDKGKIASLSISVVRNIEGFPFPTCPLNENEKVEAAIVNALGVLNMKEHFGDYFSLNQPNQKDQAEKLVRDNQLLMFQTEKGLSDLQKDYPAYRGVIQFETTGVYAIVNDMDHLRFYLYEDSPGEKFDEYFVNVRKVINEFSKQIKFASSPILNYLSTSPKHLGTGLVITIELDISTLNKKKLDTLSQFKSYDFTIVNGAKLKITNKITIGKSENEIVSDMITLCNGFFEQINN